MIDAKISFSPVTIALQERDRRMAPLAGIGVAALASAGLWGLLALGISRLF
ncbi:hypothetical protein [Caulobacter segnis]|uniref:hypothetical protein n=1 Tax=Caulobacter segnis TaxID=88688 RepID=UPI002858600A|nr:hypothetical protein [Caulobacter segnis]MDR6624789.1 hypothetical protein [Caulobacter segnis]